MIEQVSLPDGWNRHHTLYYRRWYQSRPTTNDWRENEAMIVPMNMSKHAELHWGVPPEEILPSDALVGYALRICDEISEDEEEFSRLESFTIVRNELKDIRKKRGRRVLGNEALKFVDFFDCQLDYMKALPVLGIE